MSDETKLPEGLTGRLSTIAEIGEVLVVSPLRGYDIARITIGGTRCELDIIFPDGYVNEAFMVLSTQSILFVDGERIVLGFYNHLRRTPCP